MRHLIRTSFCHEIISVLQPEIRNMNYFDKMSHCPITQELWRIIYYNHWLDQIQSSYLMLFIFLSERMQSLQHDPWDLSRGITNVHVWNLPLTGFSLKPLARANKFTQGQVSKYPKFSESWLPHCMSRTRSIRTSQVHTIDLLTVFG